MAAQSRPLGLVGDLLSILGLLMMAFSGFVVWQEGPTALLVTLNPNPGSYRRQVGAMPRADHPERTALLNELYRITPTPVATATASATEIPPVVEVAAARPGAAPTAAIAQSPRPTATPTPPPSRPRANPPVRILIPSLGVDSEVVEVGFKLVDANGVLTREWETADYAAGLHTGGPLPGATGNVVISGHNNIQGRVFRLLERAQPGDEVILVTKDNERHRYVVREHAIVPETGVSEEQRRDNARYLLPTNDKRVTLISCWPYWTNTHRVIVVAEYVGLV